MLYTKNSSEMNGNQKCEIWKREFAKMGANYFKDVKKMDKELKRIVDDVYSCDVNTQLATLTDVIKSNSKYRVN